MKRGELNSATTSNTKGVVQPTQVNMADFNSALIDFVSSRRKGVGGLLGNLLG